MKILKKKHIDFIMQHKKKFIVIWSIFAVLFVLYIILLTQAKRIETLATFPGVRINVQDVVGHVKADFDFEEINISDSQWNNINGLYYDNNAEKTVFYFHGNGWPLNYFYSEIQYIWELWYNVMAYDYPGYGESTGFPYKENVEEFSQTFFEYMKNEKNINNDELIIWGYSVGTAVATDFASKNNFEKLVLVSPFASRYDMSKSFLGVPLQKFLFQWNTFVTRQLVQDFTQPVLIVHGNKDNIVSFDQWREVYDKYGIQSNIDKKYFIEIDGYGHNIILDVYGNALKTKFLEFLETSEISTQQNYMMLDAKNKKVWEEEAQTYVNIFQSDLYTDDSITKFVNSEVSFNNKAYVPSNLVRFSSNYVADGKWYGTLRAEIIPHLEDLAKEFYQEFGTKLLINSSYRSYSYQLGIKQRGCPDNLCAKAGFSEHQSGLAFDIFSISNQATWKNNATLWKYYTWLDKNAHKYGFHNTYQKGLEIDGYEIEPWHWRYLGVDLASYLHENKITIAEFYASQNQKKQAISQGDIIAEKLKK